MRTGWDADGDWSGGGAGTDSPVANDDDDDHGDEEDQAGCRRADDERQLLLNAGVVFLCRKSRETHSHTHTRLKHMDEHLSRCIWS